MILSNLLASSKYIIVNKDLIQALGLNEAIILGELCSEFAYWESINQLYENDYFYSTRDNIYKNTGINAHFQRIAIKNLEEKEILYTKKCGIPCKTYYKINEYKIIEYLQSPRLSPKNSLVHDMNNKELINAISSGQYSFYHDMNDINRNNNNNINNKISNKRFYSKKSNNRKSFGSFNEEFPEDFLESLYWN